MLHLYWMDFTSLKECGTTPIFTMLHQDSAQLTSYTIISYNYALIHIEDLMLSDYQYYNNKL